MGVQGTTEGPRQRRSWAPAGSRSHPGITRRCRRHPPRLLLLATRSTHPARLAGTAGRRRPQPASIAASAGE
ncbi:hypothetical protein GO002_25065 [Streptomyces eurocidicus]|nr:hypothetical protein [Streptomyces eurocidicus]